MKSILSLNKRPWLFSFLILIFWIICNLLVGVVLALILQLEDQTRVQAPWPPLLANLLVVFIVAPFVLGFPGRGHTYREYLSEIRLTKMRPLLGLILLGLSCYLILALSQAAGVLVYRLMEGLLVDGSFIRRSFVLANDLPPRSNSWLNSLTSIPEEAVWRGVVLAVFLRLHDQRKSIIFSALVFGAMHIVTVVYWQSLIFAVGNVVWAAIIGLFYGYVTLKTDSLLPAMIVHYLGNLFVGAITAYIQANGSVQQVAVYGIVFTFGIIPTILMILWTRVFTRWPIMQKS
ncbi:MAG: CPBP family intramembrane metalloprotease [Anaerolineae bacterium]